MTVDGDDDDNNNDGGDDDDDDDNDDDDGDDARSRPISNDEGDYANDRCSNLI